MVRSGLDDFLHRPTEIIKRVRWAVMHILPTDDDPDTVSGYGLKCGGRYERLPRRAHASAVVQFEHVDPNGSSNYTVIVAPRYLFDRPQLGTPRSPGPV
ncbi:hypothetical protein [Micromonospora sp. CPCC 206061]|uniref:hypothetical protein n=1 Tax=Micromonospora sp. CPCC 206061 TaxID=3122410 RepID=UPI002FF358F3